MRANRGKSNMDILTPLYLLTSSCTALIFLPQMLRLLAHPEMRASMSLLTWFGFTLSSIITVCYAAFRVADTPMLVASSFYLAGNLGILLAALLPRRYRLYLPDEEKIRGLLRRCGKRDH